MKSIFLIIIIFLGLNCNAQLVRNFGNYDTTYNVCKIRLVGVSSGLAYGATIYALNKLWYNGSGKFHFYNDNQLWLQQDKIGHATTSYHEGKAFLELMKWSGVQKKGWLIAAGMSGFLFQLPIEIMDGFSPQYGASAGDLVANLSGSALVTGQYLLWGEQLIKPKFSYSISPISKSLIRPNTHGSTWNERLLKDYNGQTYWLSGNINSIISNGFIPKWLCFSLGYGIENLMYGNPSESSLNGYDGYRQYYVSLDVDFSKIKTRKKGLKVLFYFLNIVKVPFPAIEFNRNGIKGHLVHF